MMTRNAGSKSTSGIVNDSADCRNNLIRTQMLRYQVKKHLNTLDLTGVEQHVKISDCPSTVLSNLCWACQEGASETKSFTY